MLVVDFRTVDRRENLRVRDRLEGAQVRSVEALESPGCALLRSRPARPAARHLAVPVCLALRGSFRAPRSTGAASRRTVSAGSYGGPVASKA